MFYQAKEKPICRRFSGNTLTISDDVHELAKFILMSRLSFKSLQL
jgi:hypothetical protein